MKTFTNNSMNISEIINNKIATSKPHTCILTDIQKKIHSLYNNSVTLNTPLDTTLSVLKDIEGKGSVSEKIGTIYNLELVNKDSLKSMIDIHHREKKKDHSTITRYLDTLKEIDRKATDKEIKLIKEFKELSNKITTGHNSIEKTIKFLDDYFKNCENRLDETPELEKKINEYKDQKGILLFLIKYNTSQRNTEVRIEENVSKANKYNEKLNKAIHELYTITSNYTSILENSDQFESRNKILEVITKYIESIEKINTTYLNV
ncbi:hypothetical protein [Proteus columbae]|uniref:hypothetical protein n=1 Tax=Proteus columbae TaxID=1987580 RepID=UPI00288B8B34|nr:hypothetical protein [Proteus columbae]